MSYSIQDWFIDAGERGQCLCCKRYTLERRDIMEAQCYSCGRWYVGYEMGYCDSELLPLSTAYQHEVRQREHSQKYADMKFEEQMSYSPPSYEDYPE